MLRDEEWSMFAAAARKNSLLLVLQEFQGFEHGLF
jgi:hypothetical protein